jgi:hypothetical protein
VHRLTGETIAAPEVFWLASGEQQLVAGTLAGTEQQQDTPPATGTPLEQATEARAIGWTMKSALRKEARKHRAKPGRVLSLRFRVFMPLR